MSKSLTVLDCYYVDISFARGLSVIIEFWPIWPNTKYVHTYIVISA